VMKIITIITTITGARELRLHNFSEPPGPPWPHLIPFPLSLPCWYWSAFGLALFYCSAALGGLRSAAAGAQLRVAHHQRGIGGTEGCVQNTEGAFRTATGCFTPRSLTALGWLQQHHGTSVPNLPGAIFLDQVHHLPAVSAMAWICTWRTASNWNTRSTCFRCHCSPNEAEQNWRAMNEASDQGSGKGCSAASSGAWRPGKGYSQIGSTRGFVRSGRAARPEVGVNVGQRPAQQDASLNSCGQEVRSGAAGGHGGRAAASFRPTGRNATGGYQPYTAGNRWASIARPCRAAWPHSFSPPPERFWVNAGGHPVQIMGPYDSNGAIPLHNREGGPPQAFQPRGSFPAGNHVATALDAEEE